MNSGNVGRTAPIGSLVISQDGRSKFYPDGGRERPPIRGPARAPSTVGRKTDDVTYVDSKLPFGTQAVYYNTSFGKPADIDTSNVPMRTPLDDDEDNVSDTGVEPPMNPAQAFMRSFIIFGGLAIVVIIVVALAIVLPIALTGATSRATLTGTVELNSTFIAAYDDVTSTQYANLVNSFNTIMNGIFQNNSTYSSDFRETEVTDLTSGASSVRTRVLFSLHFQSGTEFNSLFRNNVYNFLYQRVIEPATPFASLNLVPDSLVITESCGLFCFNGGTLSILNCECQCMSGFSGARCESSV
ncbi:uncharacterized protein LOC110985440 isoform X2 [Acanthaster planci]|uniref:Uncharacterized protein LOC110985440 isoform X2 n=1 Tax=Acanthaster planci TaxID=133434 RepID=A0A8B7Z914_ACAPL|nr:uncharacterized protein LOC110985440 isoform X2 [Acanthaster planci]